MIFKRIFFAIAGLLIINTAILRAGDSAIFVDLGFSPDGSYYMFAQHGVRSETLRPWADLFIVDVARNDFVPGGRITYVHDRPILPGQDGAGVMNSLIAQNAAIAGRYGITFAHQGQPLYIALEGDPAFRPEPITFRDFNSGISYRASLEETIRGSGLNTQSSFHITVERTTDTGSTGTFTVGTPIWRPLITSYRIRRVLIDPTGSSLIFIIEMKRIAEGGTGLDVRYMIEALRL